MTTQASQTLVTRELVPEDWRPAITEKLFGIHFPLQLEPVVYGITERMAEDYDGGYWDFFTLSNGGFYMAPSNDQVFYVACDNMFEGELSADALGITAACTPTAICHFRMVASPEFVHAITTDCVNTCSSTRR